MRATNDVVLQIRIKREMLEAIQVRAKERGKSVSELARGLLEQWLEHGGKVKVQEPQKQAITKDKPQDKLVITMDSPMVSAYLRDAGEVQSGQK